jgi:membrane fusion protein
LTSIFREEAIQEAQSHLKGDISIVQSSNVYFFLFFLLSLIITTIAFLSVATFERKFTTKGFVHPTGFSNEIFSNDSGYVSELFIKEGSLISKGELLGVIVRRNFGPDGQDIQSAVIKNIKNKIIQIQHELTTFEAQHTLLLSQIKDQIKHSNYKVKLKLRKAENLDERMKLSLSNIKQLKTLTGEGYISKLSLLQYKDQHLELTHLGIEASEDIYSERELKSKLLMELKSIELENDNKISSLNQQIQEAKLSLLLAENDKTTELRASSSGMITGLTIKSGQSVRANSRLYTIIPENDVLQGVIYIPSKNFGFVKTGQRLRIRYSAFPHDVYGSASGRLLTLGENISMPHEVEISGFIKESSYRATIQLDNQNIAFGGERLNIKVGMSFKTDVILEEQSLLNWLLGPVWSYLGEN